jgi:HSP20 family protein
LKYYFNDFFDDKFLNDLTGLTSRRTTKNVYPQCNISQTDKGSFNFNLCVPGFSRNDFAIDVKNNVLTVKGQLSETSRLKYIQQEFAQYASFERSWTLPKDVNVDSIDASYDAGILQISVPLLEERKPETKRITVQ